MVFGEASRVPNCNRIGNTSKCVKEYKLSNAKLTVIVITPISSTIIPIYEIIIISKSIYCW